jgi:hypothetical protein
MVLEEMQATIQVGVVEEWLFLWDEVDKAVPE